MSSTNPEGRPDGRERLLLAAVRHLETHGEADLRVTEIAEQADVVIGLIRHHFGSRDGLVAAAQQRRVEGAAREDLAGIRTVLGTIKSPDDLLVQFDLLTRQVVDRSRAEVRLSRFAAIAAAHGRPDAQQAIGGALGDLLDDFAALVREAQENGIVRRDLDARAIVTFIQAYSLGLIVHDLDPQAPEADLLAEVIRDVVRGLLDVPSG
jgi:AcrR family transcriptional regulator